MPRLRHFVWPAVLVLLAGGAWAAWHFWPRAAGPLNGLTWGEVTRGDLEIDSQPGRGTRIAATFPLAGGPQP